MADKDSATSSPTSPATSGAFTPLTSPAKVGGDSGGEWQQKHSSDTPVEPKR